MKPCGPPGGERLLTVFDCLNVLEIWRQCDGASAEYGTFSLVEIQRLGSPDIVHNMRRSGLSTTAPDGHPATREDFSPPILTNPLRYEGTW